MFFEQGLDRGFAPMNLSEDEIREDGRIEVWC